MILAIDQGTTGTTVLVVNKRGKIVGSGYREFTQYYPKPGWVEHDPMEILQSTFYAMRKALQDAQIKAKQCEAIGITNQRETTLLWDRQTGKPISKAIVWQCRRTAPICESLKKKGKEKRFRQKTGLVIDAYFSGTKIQWMLDHVKGARQKARQGKLAFGTVDTWLLWHLTGGQVHATDFTNASRTLLYNIGQHRWDADLLKTLRVPSSILPEVKPPSAFYGTTVRNSVLPAGIPITGMVGDQQASMVGHGCLTPGTAKNTYGTGCFLLLHTGKKKVQSKHGLLTTLVSGQDEQPTYALEGAVFIAGAAIQWLRDELRIIENAAETERIARSVKDTGGVYMVPAFVGLGAPYWDMDARAAVVGLTRGSNREILVRATLESLAYQTYDVMDAMQKDSGIRFKRLRVDGGAAQNNWLMQFQADLLGIPVERPQRVENTGKGAALLAGAEIGWWHLKDLDRFIDKPNKTFEPKLSTKARKAKIAGWHDAIDRVKSSSR